MNNDFSFSLNREELFALERLVASLPAGSPGVASTRCLRSPLDLACTSMRGQAASDSCDISLSLEPSQADSLAGWLGALTVDQIEHMVDDADIADSASLALWSMLEVLRPLSLRRVGSGVGHEPAREGAWRVCGGPRCAMRDDALGHKAFVAVVAQGDEFVRPGVGALERR